MTNTTRRRTRGVPLALLAGLVAAACPASDVSILLEEMDARVRDLTGLRDGLVAELPVQQSEDIRHGCCVITVQGGLDGHDLVVQAVLRDGAFTDARAWSPGGSPLHFAADPTGLLVADGRVAGELVVDVLCWAGLPDHDPDLGALRPVRYRLDVPLAAKETGTAAVLNPATAAALGGTASARFVPVGRPSFDGPPELSRLLEQERIARLHAHAMTVWHQLRALELTRRVGLPYELASKQIPEMSFTWPGLEAAATAAGEDGDRDGGDDLLDLEAEIERLGTDTDEVAARGRPVLSHLEAYVAAARAGLAAEPHEVPVGSADPGDPDFVPAFGSEPAGGEDAVLVLPDTLGQPGPVRWVHPRRGQIASIGPTRLTPWGGHSPVLPAFIPDRRTLYRAPIAAIKAQGYPRSAYLAVVRRPAVEPEEPERWDHKKWGALPEGATHHPRPWDLMPVRPLTGRMYPPYSCKPNYTFPGWEYTGSCHVVEVESPRATTAWCTVGASYAAALRVGGRLVWRSDRLHADPQNKPHAWLVRMPLERGRNRVVLHTAHVSHGDFFALRFCVRGGPRGADEAAALADRRRAAYAGMPGQDTAVRQFRRDHTGVHPDAAPPLAFDCETGRNVAWFRRLAHGVGNALVMGDRVITTEAPNAVVALDKATGDVRWRRRVDRFRIAHPDLWKRAAPLYAKIDALEPTDPKLQAERKALYAELAAIYPEKYQPKPEPDPKPSFTSPIMCCPITDGKRLWVKQNAEVLACLDADGTERWIVDLGAEGGQMGWIANSPVLHDGAILCQIPAYGKKPPTEWDRQGGWPWDRHPGRRARLVCHDAETGERRWATGPYSMPHWGNRYDADGIATPLVVPLSDGGERMDVIVTGGGQVWRAADGKRLLDSVGHRNVSHPFYPLGEGRFLTFNQADYHKSGGYPALVRLIMDGHDAVRAETLWVGQRFRNFGLGGCVLVDGLLVGYEGRRRGRISAFDMETGELAAQRFGIFRCAPGHAYPSPSLAGGVLYAFCDGRIGFNKGTRWAIDQRRKKGEDVPYPEWLGGNCSAVLPGRDTLVLARNELPPADGLTYGAEIDGESMYLRLRSGLLCLRADDAGRAWQAEAVAETLLAQLPTAPLADAPPLEPARRLSARQFADGKYRGRRGGIRFLPGAVRTGWYGVGPMPPDAADALEAKIVDGKRNWLHAGKGLPDAFAGQPLTDLSHDRNFKKGWNSALTPEDCVARMGVAYDIALAHEGAEDTALYWLGAMVLRGRKILRWDCPGERVRCWIGGTPITHGQCIALERGTWQVVLRTDLPPGVEPAPIRPRFWDATDPAAERAFVADRLRRMRPYLDTALELTDDADLHAAIAAARALVE